MRKALLAVGLTSLILAAITLLAVWSGVLPDLMNASDRQVSWERVEAVQNFAFGIGGLGIVCLVIGAKLKP